MSTIVYLALTSAVVLASGSGPGYCTDFNNGTTYQADQLTYWYTQVETASRPCIQGVGCYYVFTTEGGKGNLSTGGAPYTWDNAHQHVSSYISADEYPGSPANCAFPGCWIQIGWQVGYSNSTCSDTIDPSSPQVYVEIYDNSTSNCFLSTFGAAPPDASYDGRYYAKSGTFYQYNAYFEVPGSNNIQWLAYADFTTLKTAEIASGEVYAPLNQDGSTPDCPVLGQITNNEWDYDGQPSSQPTFASSMNLYTGSWQNWTISAAQTATQQTDNYSEPYEIQPVSDFNAGNYTEWEMGGPF